MKNETKIKKKISLLFSLLICVCAGLGYAWSVFQNPIAEYFPQWNSGGISIAFTIQIALSAVAPLVFGGFFSQWKTKTIILVGGLLLSAGLIGTSFMSSLMMLYLFYGVFSGLGIGMIYTTLMTYAVRLFPEKKGLMSGIVAASYGSGAIIWAPVANAIISSYSVLFCYRVLGCLFFAVIVGLSFFLIEVPKADIANSEQKAEPALSSASSSRDKTRSDMVRMPIFYITVIMITLGVTAGLMLTGYASPILQSQVGFSPTNAATIVGLLAISNSGGRLFWGNVADKISIYVTTTLLFVLQISAILLMALLPSYTPVFVVMMFLVYLCYGGFATIIAPTAADLFGLKNLTSNYGLMYVAYGIAGIVGPRIAATFQSLFESQFQAFTNSFYLAAGLCFIGLMLNLLVMKMIKSPTR